MKEVGCHFCDVCRGQTGVGDARLVGDLEALGPAAGVTVRFNQSDNNTPRICGRFGWKAWRQGCSRSAYMDKVVTMSSAVG